MRTKNYMFNKAATVLLLMVIAYNQRGFAQSPGGVSTNLKLWLKANTGVTGTTTVTAWADQSGQANNATAAGTAAGTAPSLTTTSMNFNPAVTFAISTPTTNYKYLKTSTNPVTGAMSLIAVYKTAAASSGSGFTGSQGLLSGEVTSATNDYGLGLNGTEVAMKGSNAYDVITGCAVVGVIGSIHDTYDGNTFEVTNGTANTTNLPFIAIGTRLPATNTLVTTTGCLGATYSVPQADGVISLYSNGTLSGTDATRSYEALTSPTGLGIGNGSTGVAAEQFSGDISEAIAYSGVLATTDRQKIESYLGIKYGITLPNNYLASDGTTVYNVATYGNYVAGIGRDDNAGLNQKQSQASDNTTMQVVMSLGTVATNNPSNTNVFAIDKNFLIWGDNGTTGTTAVVGGISGYSINSILAKTYSLQNTGIAKTVTVYYPASAFPPGTIPYLITNSTPGVTGATATTMSTATTNINAVTYYSTTYTWPANTTTYFTFGSAPYAAGGVPGMTSWFRADAGTNTTTNGGAITTWTNQAINANVVSLTQTTATRQPTYKTVLWNFNPAISFDGLPGTNGDILTNTAIGNVTNVFATTDLNSFFGVLDIEGTNGTSSADPVYFQVSAGGAVGSSKFGLEGHNLLYPIGGSVALGATNISLTSTLPSIVSAYTIPLNANFTLDEGTPVTGTYTGAFTSSTSNPTYMVGGFLFGGASGTYDYFMKGNYTEILTYNTALTPIQRQQIQSYLGVKYGKTLPLDYLASNGIITYTVSGYASNIAGIGRDDQTYLNQKQSQSINAGNQVLMSLGIPLASNQLNASTVAGDRQYLVWGDNGGADTIMAETSVAYVARRTVKWFKAQNTNFGQAVKVMYPASALTGYTTVNLITNSSSAITAGATLTPMTLTTVNGVSYYTADYTFPVNSSTYFTFGVAQGIYYVKTGTSDISIATNWTTDSTGATATSPANFTTAANLFIINNSVGGSNTATLSNPLTISGQDARMSIMGYNTGTPSLIISPTGCLTVGTGTVADFNGKNVIIRSTVAGTGSIGQTTGTLSNATNVTIERYLAGGRKWHMLTASTTGTQTIYNAWQESGSLTNTGYGTYITNGTMAGGNGYDAAPFDATISGLSSSLRVFSSNATTTSTLVNTNTTALTANAAYFLFVRGDRTAATYSAYEAQPTTLRNTGTLRQGSIGQTLSAAGAGFDILYNPFPSAVSLAAAINPPATIYLWDPNYGQYFGGYITYTRSGIAGSYAYTTTAANPTYGNTLTGLQSGQGFLAARGGGNTFTIGETHKITTALNLLKTTNLPVGVTSGIVMRVQSYEGTVLTERDVTDARFASSYSNTMVYGEDAPKSGNFGENLSFYRSGEWLAIEKRQAPVVGDTLFVQLWKTSAIPYNFQIEAGGLPGGLQPYLTDNFTHTQTPLNVSGTINYIFTSNGANVDLNRFFITFTNAVTLPVTITDINAYKQADQVNVTWDVVNEDGIASYEVEKSTDGTSFASFATVKPANEIHEHSYTAIDGHPVVVNFYRVKSIGFNSVVKYSRIIKLGTDNNGAPIVNVYPTPVTGSTVNINYTNLPMGSYNVSVYSNDGKQVIDNQIEVKINGTVSQTIDLPKNRPTGVYFLKVNGGNVNISKKISVELNNQ